jgi:hypothetical protein
MALLVCPSCYRHARADGGVCPFCGADLAQCRADRVAQKRLSRLGVVLASAMAVGLGPCTDPLKTHTEPPPTSDAAASKVAVYGGPPNFQAERLQQELLDELADAGQLYSADSPIDAGTRPDAHAPSKKP